MTRRVITVAQQHAIERATRSGATRAQAARAAGVPEWRLYQAIRDGLIAPAVRLGPKPGTKYRPRQEFVEIPEDEIYRRAAELRRERWSDDEQSARFCKGFYKADQG